MSRCRAVLRLRPRPRSTFVLRVPSYTSRADPLPPSRRSLATKYPKLASVKKIGTTIGNRDISSVIVTSTKSPLLAKPAIKLVGGVHGNEVLGPELLVRFLQHLTSQYGKDAAVTGLVDTTVVHVVPFVNADGFARAKSDDCYSTDGFLNDAKVNIERDFFYNQEANSTAETKALMRWMAANRFVIGANLMGGSLTAFYPFSRAPEVLSEEITEHPTPDHAVFQALATTYASHHGAAARPSMGAGLWCNTSDPLGRFSQPGQREGTLGGFPGGISNSFARIAPEIVEEGWDEVKGDMGDFSYLHHGCLDLRLEVGCCLYPRATELPLEWEANKPALMAFAAEVHTAVHGRVVDETGAGVADQKVSFGVIDAATKTFQRKGPAVYTNGEGHFWRMLRTAGGYGPRVHHGEPDAWFAPLRFQRSRDCLAWPVWAPACPPRGTTRDSVAGTRSRSRIRPTNACSSPSLKAPRIWARSRWRSRRRRRRQLRRRRRLRPARPARPARPPRR